MAILILDSDPKSLKQYFVLNLLCYLTALIKLDIESTIMKIRLSALLLLLMASVSLVPSTFSQAPGTPLLTLVVTADPESYTAIGEVINYSYLVSSTGNAPVIGPITVGDSRMTVSCPPVDSVGNNDANLDIGESLVCTSSLVTTHDDIIYASIDTSAVAEGANAISNAVGHSVPFIPPAPVPTLSQWSMLVLSFLFLLMGVSYMRRKQATKV